MDLCLRLRARYDKLQQHLHVSIACSTRSTVSGTSQRGHAVSPLPAWCCRGTGGRRGVGPTLVSLTSVLSEMESLCGVGRDELERHSIERVRSRAQGQRCRGAGLRGGDSLPCSLLGDDLMEGRVRSEDMLVSSDNMLQDWGPSSLGKAKLRVSPKQAGRAPRLLLSWPAWAQASPQERRLEGAQEEGSPKEHREQGHGTGASEHQALAEAADADKGDELPRVTLMLQYYKQPSILGKVVEEYARCTRRNESAGKEQVNAFPFPVELLANVDQPGEWRDWTHQWAASRNILTGSLSSRSFLSVFFSHNSHEIQGYNNVVRAAQGDVVVMVQDDDMSPIDCNWLTRIVREMEERPNVGCVGYNTAVLLDGAEITRRYHQAALSRDPVTGYIVNFAQWVDIGPMAILRCAWLQLGGFDEAFGPRGQSGILSDWQMSQRLWSSGFWIVYLPSSGDYEMQLSAVMGTTRQSASLSNSYREMNQRINGLPLGTLARETNKEVALEVHRSNMLLVNQ